MTIPHRLSAALAGRYRIERELGAGGMATVYLAEDLKHDRKVAIKVLKPELAAVLGAERFVVEIKTTAALQHPHILPLFDSGTADSFLFYVMPYIQGETIREKLNRETQFGVDDAVRIAREVADALDYAHRHGVIHRDIKPENILLHDGRAMVMDFGIALAVSAAAGGRMTETGLSLGTPHYMSPEQATAEKEITPRSDIYSLASVLYEMLAGQPPHIGGAAQQVIMKIITEQAAAVTSLRKSVPANVSAALARALEKLPADRFETAKAFADALASAHFTHGTAPIGAASSPAAARRRLLTIAAVAIAAGLAGFTIAAGLRPSVTPSVQPARFVVNAPPSAPLGQTPFSNDIALSPTGTHIAYLTGAPRRIYIRALNALSGEVLSGTELADGFFFSPDGQWIAFAADQTLRKISIHGGTVTPITTYPTIFMGGSWGTSDTIVFADLQRGILRTVPASGGTSRAVGDTGSATMLPLRRLPEMLPGGRAVLFTHGPIPSPSVYVLDLKTGIERELIPGGNNPRYSPTGHVVYAVGASLWAVAFDADRLEVSGSPVVVLNGVKLNARGVASFAIANDGSLAYEEGGGAGGGSMPVAWLDGSGKATPIPGLGGKQFRDVRVSPDGRTLALAAAGDIWTFDVARGALTQLTSAPAQAAHSPVWTRDGRRIAFTSGATAKYLLWRRADGTGSADTLLALPDANMLLDVRAYGWTLDATRLLFSKVPATIRCAIGQHAIGPESRVEMLRDLENTCSDFPALSPDGRWLAFAIGPPGVAGFGQADVHVQRFPEGTERQRVSTGFGNFPAWSADGRELFYLAGDTLIAVPVRSGATLELGRPRALFTAPFRLSGAGIRPWDIAPDGRFVGIMAPSDSTNRTVNPNIVLVQRWTDLLRGAGPPR